jgi:hypothetical protein
LFDVGAGDDREIHARSLPPPPRAASPPLIF